MPVTTLTAVGRLGALHPDLDFDAQSDGGIALHAALAAMHTLYSNHLFSRWTGSQTLANSAFVDVTHNFAMALVDLRVQIHISDVLQTAAQVATNFTITEQSANVIRITNISGSSKTFKASIHAATLGVQSTDLDPALSITTSGSIVTTGNVQAAEFRSNGEDLVLNYDATASGADWKSTIRRPSSGMAAAAIHTLPTITGTLPTLAALSQSFLGLMTFADLVTVKSGTGKGIDVETGADMYIGQTNANTIWMGRSGQTLKIVGNFEVDGTTTFINTTNLNVADNNITLNKGGTTVSAAGAGLAIEGTSAVNLANILYDGSLTSKFKLGAAGSELEILTSSASQTATNKNLASSTNTLTGATCASLVNTGIVTFFTATDTVVGKATTDNLTNKNLGSSTNTLTGATCASLVNTGTVSFFTSTDTVVGKATTDNLTNKNLGSSTNTLTGATCASLVNTGTVSFFTATDTVVGRATIDALTNKDIDGGTATNARRITLPQETTTNLTALTRKKGTLVYDNTLDVVKYDTGATLIALAATAVATSTATGTVTSFVPTILSAIKVVSSANYSILTADGYSSILVTTGASDRTIDLPAAASNTGREIYITKVDSGAGRVIIDPNASELIDGALTNTLNAQKSYITLICDGTGWTVKSVWDYVQTIDASFTVSTIASGSPTTVVSRTFDPGTWMISINCTLAFVGATVTAWSGGIASVTNSITGWSGADTSNDGSPPNINVSATVVIQSKKVLTTATPFFNTVRANYGGGTAPVAAGKIYATRMV